MDAVVPSVKEAPEPSVIIWRNLRISNRNRFLRTVFTTLVTIGILVGTIIVLITIKYYQNTFVKEYDVSLCGSVSVTKGEA